MYVALRGIVVWSYQCTVVVYLYCICYFFVEYQASWSGYWQTSFRILVIILNSRFRQFFRASMSSLSIDGHISDFHFLVSYFYVILGLYPFLFRLRVDFLVHWLSCSMCYFQHFLLDFWGLWELYFFSLAFKTTSITLRALVWFSWVLLLLHWLL